MNDLDGNGVIDACDPDVDGDGALNGVDICPSTQPGTAASYWGAPKGDITDDCRVTVTDGFFFEICARISGPGRVPA